MTEWENYSFSVEDLKHAWLWSSFFFFASCLLGSRVFLKMLFYLHWIRTEVYCFSLNMILWIKKKFDMTVWYLECKRSVFFLFLNGVTPCYRKTVFVLLRNMAYIIWNCLCGRVPFDNIVLSKQLMVTGQQSQLAHFVSVATHVFKKHIVGSRLENM